MEGFLEKKGMGAFIFFFFVTLEGRVGFQPLGLDSLGFSLLYFFDHILYTRAHSANVGRTLV